MIIHEAARYFDAWRTHVPNLVLEETMPVRTARVAWEGDLDSGSGEVELSSSKAGTFSVSWPKRTSDTADGTTSPEELIAGAHASCYAMEFSAVIAQRGGTPGSLEITADVSIVPDNPGWKINTIKLTVRGEVGGLDDAAFRDAAEAAKQSCPVSKALTGVNITVDAALKS
jgi:osmotically inducible protein OsmC